MRTTIRLDDQLLQAAKRMAQESGRTLTAFIEDALRQVLARKQIPSKRRPVRLPTVNGNGLQRAVDLDDSSALLAVMEEE